jgi:hypothetical protein
MQPTVWVSYAYEMKEQKQCLNTWYRWNTWREELRRNTEKRVNKEIEKIKK